MNADALAFLAAKGFTIEEIVEFARLSERKRDNTNAERQARYREKQRNAVTVTPVTDEVEAEKIPPHTPHKNSSTPVSPKGDTAPKGAGRSRGSKIPEGWALPDKAELGPKFRPLAEQWTTASYETEGAAFHSFWLAETGARASKSCWKRAWENRIAQIHSKVMRDQKFGNAPTDAPAIPANPLDPLLQAERTAALYRRMGREDDARAEDERAARLRGGPVPIGQAQGGIRAGLSP